MRGYLVLALTIGVLGALASARPSRQRGRGRSHDMGMSYLYEFGYLPRSDMEKEVVRPRSHVRRATKMLQKFMSMPQTGHFDADTMGMMAKPRCGVSDMKMTDKDFMEDAAEASPAEFRLLPNEPRWDKYDLTYHYTSYSPTHKLGPRDIRDAVQRAFQTWSDATRLTFREVRDASQADILLEFARYDHQDGYPFDDAGGVYGGNVLAHAFAPGEGIGGDVHFDDYEPWAVRGNQGVDLFFVALHEIGHALGLGHSDVIGSIMYPTYNGYVPDLGLSDDDLVIIQYLYGTGDEKAEEPSSPSTTTSTTTTTTTTTAAPAPGPGPNPDGPPNVCDEGVDAAALVEMGDISEAQILMFKGNWFWRRTFNSMIESNRIHSKWTDLPEYVTTIDAAYQNTQDGRLTLFSLQRFWEFEDTRLVGPRHGRPLTDLGLPYDLEKVDAVFTWGYNSRTYIVSGNRYWRLDDVTGRAAPEYPRSMALWEGVPAPLDAAFQLWDGRTYFFKGQDFFVFNDQTMKVEATYKGETGRYWLWCY